MYKATEKQEAAERRLIKQGFSFGSWIPAQPDAENQPAQGTESLGTMVMVKRNHRFALEYREIDPNGFIN